MQDTLIEIQLKKMQNFYLFIYLFFKIVFKFPFKYILFLYLNIKNLLNNQKIQNLKIK